MKPSGTTMVSPGCRIEVVFGFVAFENIFHVHVDALPGVAFAQNTHVPGIREILEAAGFDHGFAHGQSFVEGKFHGALRKHRALHVNTSAAGSRGHRSKPITTVAW